MRLIDADELIYMTIGEDTDTPFKFVPTEFIENAEEVDAIPIGYIDQVIDEYEHMIEHYLYDDDEDLKEYLYYRNCLNNLKRRWKKQCKR